MSQSLRCGSQSSSWLVGLPDRSKEMELLLLREMLFRGEQSIFNLILG